MSTAPRKPRGKPDSAEIFFPPGWSEEIQFAIRRYFNPDRLTDHLSRPERLSLPACLNAIKLNWPEAPFGLPTREGAKWIIDAVREWGIQAIYWKEIHSEEPVPSGPSILIRGSPPSLRLTDEECLRLTHEECERWRALNSFVSAAIGQWQRTVHLGRPEPSLSFLKQLGKALLPEARGKGKRRSKAAMDLDLPTANRVDVGIYYYRMLFRVTAIQRDLLEPKISRSQKVRAASSKYNISEKDIRELWQLDDDNLPTVKPPLLKQMARILTVKHFGLTQHRVSNILAS